MTGTVLLQQSINALALGAIYSMIAVGLAMIYGVLRILHIAHAGVYAAGAYIAVGLVGVFHNFALALVGAMVLAAFIGALMERLIYRPMIARPRVVILTASIGLLICMTDVFRIVAGPHQLPLSAPFLQTQYSVGDVRISGTDVFILAGTALIFAALWLFMTKTRFGFEIRAVAQDQEAAKINGIDVDRCVQVVFAIGSAIAAFGGVLVAVLYNAVYTNMGDVIAYKGLALIVIGGFGSMTGAVLAAFMLGAAETFIITYANLPLSREGLAMLLLIALLLWRPQGLMGKT
jgi:branched-chain amino acid transport system permease protein